MSDVLCGLDSSKLHTYVASGNAAGFVQVWKVCAPPEATIYIHTHILTHIHTYTHTHIYRHKHTHTQTHR
jgi:hypothetical protein